MCKTHEIGKKQFSHGFHYQIMGWKVCDHYKGFVNKQLDQQPSFNHNYHMQLITRPKCLGQIT
jgi:hypothetical protein